MTHKTKVVLACLGFVVLGACGMILSGCTEPTTTSPLSGKQVTLGQYQFEDQQARRKEQTEATEKQDKAQAEIDAATRKAKLAMTTATAMSSIEVAKIQDELDAIVASATTRANFAVKELDQRLAALDDSKHLAEQQIAKNRQAVIDAWGILKPFAAMIPVVGGQVQTAGDQAVSSWAGPQTLLTLAGVGAAAVQTVRKGRSDRRGKAMVNHVDTLRSDPKVKFAMKNADPVIKAKAEAQLATVPGAADLLKSESVT